MKKNLLIALLALALLAETAWAWREYRDLVVLRAELADGNLALVKGQLAEAQKTIRGLQDRLLAARGRRGGPGTEGPGDGPAGDAGPEGPGGGRGGRWGAWARLANDPEFQRLMAIQVKGRISQTYAPLFKSLNLSPDQLAQFQSLLAEKQQALADVMGAAREQGINPRQDPDAFKTLVGQALAQSDQAIQQALGDAAYQQYQQYQQTLPERNTVGTLSQSLSYTQTPLTEDQASQLQAILAANQPQRAGNGTAGTDGNTGPSPMALLNGGGQARVTADAITQASGVLSAPQLAALQQIQEQQQAQQQLQQLMRASQQGSGGTPAVPATPASGGGKG